MRQVSGDAKFIEPCSLANDSNVGEHQHEAVIQANDDKRASTEDHEESEDENPTEETEDHPDEVNGSGQGDEMLRGGSENDVTSSHNASKTDNEDQEAADDSDEMTLRHSHDDDEMTLHPQLRRSSRVSKPPRHFEEFAMLTYSEAMSDDKWRAAIESELESLREHHTWGPPAQLPANRRLVDVKWVFKEKLDSDGNVKHKARLVARGFTQVNGIDYQSTFSPVVQPTLLRTLLSLAAHHSWVIKQADIKTAFLYGELKEEIYIQLPDKSIRRLHKALYGLKQASRAWNTKFDNFITKRGFERSQTDPCCYFMKEASTYILIHVDDILVFSPTESRANNVIRLLGDEFNVVSLGDCKSYLGLEISRDHTAKTLSMKQASYIKKLLSKYGMDECNEVSTPADTSGTKEQMESTTADEDNRRYMEILGSLLYVANNSRPDISYAVSELAKKANSPSPSDWKALKRVMRYLRGTINHGIVFGGGRADNENPPIVAYVDANYAGCVETRKSRYGGLIMVNNGTVEWRSKMQPNIALSSMESEYIGACEVAKVIMWLRQAMEELGFRQTKPTILHIDNSSAKYFAEENIVQNKSKHIDVKYHYIREKILEKDIELKHLPTEQMPADALTKPLGLKFFKRFRDMMNVKPISG